MTKQRQRAVPGRAVCFAVWLLSSVPVLQAQQLAIRRYDLRDGLAHSRVMSIYQDRKGTFGSAHGKGSAGLMVTDSQITEPVRV